MSDPDFPRGRGRFLVPLIGGSAILCLIWFLASFLAPIVDAGWFGLQEQTDALAGPGVLWVSFFLIATALYAVLAAATSVPRLAELRLSHLIEWPRKISAFLALLYGLAGLHFVILIERAGDHPRTWLWGSLFEVLMVSLLAALVWPLVFRPVSPRAVGAIFGLSFITLCAALVLVDPEVITVVLIALGAMEPPRFLLLGSSFSALPYLAPVPAVLWAAFDRLRRRPSPR